MTDDTSEQQTLNAGSNEHESLGSTLAEIYSRSWSRETEALLFKPVGDSRSSSIDFALDIVERETGRVLSEWLLPLMWVDEASIACVTIDTNDNSRIGEVRRLHLRAVPEGTQLRLLDVDSLLYVESVDEELVARPKGLRRVLDQVGPAFENSHLKDERRPRDYVVRPVRIACQNVIVALGAITQDSSFDGLSVPAWQTCEVPHVATHEANRALAALTLCDAFQNGGTMEIRFDRKARINHKGGPLTYDGHPEGRVPASLRRFGRTVGIPLGVEDPASISPREARSLFLAITPMPGELRAYVERATSRSRIAPERICFLLLSQVWREVEMEYLLAVSGRSGSILAGGDHWRDRTARQAESEVCRSAVMAGMLHRRLNNMDAAAAGDSAVRVVEDRSKGIRWVTHPAVGAVTFPGLESTDAVPWTRGLTDVDTLTVFPRSSVNALTLEQIASADVPGHKALLVPADEASAVTPGVSVLRCPDRIADIDRNIEERLLKSRISRG